MLYNIKVVYLYCVFHGIRFKVNEDWVSVIDTLLFFLNLPDILLYSSLLPRKGRNSLSLCKLMGVLK